MPLPKASTLLNFTDEGDRAKRRLVRKQDNLAGGNRQSQPNYRQRFTCVGPLLCASSRTLPLPLGESRWSRRIAP